MISGAQLRALFSSLPAPALSGYAEPLSEALKEFAFETPAAIAALLATLHHESMGLTRWEESFAYSPERLHKVFPRIPLEECQAIVARGPEAIANRIYGGRMDNRNPGDGYRYRGRGPHQLTGARNYGQHGAKLGIPLLEIPEALLTPVAGFRSACLFAKEAGLGSQQLGNCDTLTTFLTLQRRWNGVFAPTLPNGWEDRQKQFRAARAVFDLPVAA